ncbi:MAG: SelB C-terminal domain-containing protein, partial [Firmicutes bacterium]|nr:SelB C-terminal domain-containing protein [Bacillota bacterium]
GTAEVLGRLHLLDREELLPGARCFCQLLLEKPLPPLRQDKLILRSYSPMNVVGAATVLKADAARHKRYRPEIICAMENSLFADAGDVLLNALALGNSLYSANKLAQICQLPQKEIAPLLQNFGNSHKLAAFIIDGETHYTTTVKLNEWRNLLQKAAADHHQKYPLRLGLPLATARAQFFPAFSYKQLTILIEKWCSEGYFRLHNARLACADFLPLPCFEQKQWLESIEEDYINNLLDPPEWVKEMEQLKIPLFEQTELLLWLCEQGLLIKVAEGLYFHKQAIVFALEALQPLKNTGGFSLAQARDLWHTSRKYALPLLEYFDQEKITKRIADKRILL